MITASLLRQLNETTKPTPKPRQNGTGKQGCSQRPCRYRSLPGLTRGQGLCPYHWAVKVWGQKWADTIYLPDADVR